MSSERYFIIRDKPSRGDIISLGAEESLHLVKVVRARAGDEVNLLDGEGGVYRAVVIDPGIAAASLEITGKENTGPAFPVDLAIPMMRMSRMDFAIEKCAEIGIRSIVPFSSQRSVWKGGETEAIKKRERLERKVEAACKQSGNPWLTRIEPVTNFLGLTSLFGKYDRVLVASAEGRSCIEIETVRGNSTLGVVGPEGGLTYDERETIIKAGAVPISLGHLRLRSETAAACLAWFMISAC